MGHAPTTEAKATAQRRHMTVLFCDMVGSTPLAERLDPEEFREILSGYQHACVRAIERTAGYTANFVGDGIVAYFGYPRAHEDDAQRAVHAGLGILQELKGLNTSLQDLGIVIQVRIGIHSGLVVAGELRAGENQAQTDIVGEMPHIAARLESIAPHGAVVISEDTRDLTEGYFETESLGEQHLKGVSRPIEAHRVLRPTGATARLEVAVGRPLTPVVGRDPELARLVHAWNGIEPGSGALAQVIGEAGIGKSRLVHAFRARLGDRPSAIHVWQCSGHHEATTLYPVIRCLERLLELDRAQHREVQLAAVEKAAASAGLDVAEAVPLLADLLSIGWDPLEQGPAPELAPRDARTATLRILESLIVADPANHPLLLVVEDLQWADPTTIELLGRIVGGLNGLPVLCVLTFRPEFDPPWSGRDRLDFELGPLTREQVRTMVAAASESQPDPNLVAWVEAAADGVPLFVEEMVKMLKLRGNAQSTPGTRAEINVPPTLEGLLTERLDRLPDLGDVIDAASVIGREFERELLEALDPLAGAELDPALTLLIDQGIVRPLSGTGSRFEFTHALLQEAAYERLLRPRRRALHGRVADTLSTRFATVAEREPELVAHHFSRADEPAKATAYWRAAGSRALERAAFQEAAEHFRRALEALDEARPGNHDPLLRADLLTHRAASLQAARGYAAAGVADAYAEARSGYERAGDDERLLAVIRGEWMFYLLRGQYATALELADEMLALGQAGGDPVRLAEGHLYGGLVHMYLGDFARARDQLDEAFGHYRRPERHDQIYDAQGDTGVGALAYNGIVLWNLGYPGRAQELSDRSLELAEQLGGQVTRAQAWGMRSILHLTRSEPTDFSHWVEMSHAHSVEHNIGYWRTLSSLFNGWLRARAGDVPTGINQLEQSLEEYVVSGATLSLPLFQLLLADLRLVAADRSGALEAVRAGEEYIETTGERFSESDLFRTKGRALMSGESPDPDAATAAYQRSVDTARALDAKLPWLRASTQLAAHQLKLGQDAPELQQLEQLCAWFEPDSELPDLGRARAVLAQEAAAR